MKPNINIVIVCVTLLIVATVFYFCVASFNATILQAANITGDKLSPRLQPTEHTINVEGGVTVANRKGTTLDIGATIGKGGQ